MTMTDTHTSSATGAARPTLLTVICIISFIMGAWSIFGGIKTMTQDSDAVLQEARSVMEQARADLGDQANGLAGRMMDSAMELAENTARNAKKIGISEIVFSLLGLIGVWMMWNLRKNGFWLYVVAAVAGLAAQFTFMGGGMAALTAVGFTAFFTLIFIILYAVNLKHMH